ncbi:MAG: methyltransferase family protein [Phycicoccus sp.]
MAGEDLERTPRAGPDLRVWPPFSVLLPWLSGAAVTYLVGNPVRLPVWSRTVAWALVLGFVAWGGWVRAQFGRHRTGFLPGEGARVLMTTGPYRLSRNPWYLGLLTAYVGLALLAPSVWALLLLPVAVGLLLWGAILPEERYLRAEFGPEYEEYARRVRRWW